jgi:hypothetical protein
MCRGLGFEVFPKPMNRRSRRIVALELFVSGSPPLQLLNDDLRRPWSLMLLETHHLPNQSSRLRNWTFPLLLGLGH